MRGQLFPRSPKTVTPHRWASVAGPTGAINWEDLIWVPELSLWLASGWAAGPSGRMARSRDGRTWTVQTVNTSQNSWEGLAWSPLLRRAVAVSDTGTSRVATSPDGITWTRTSGIGGTVTWRRVIWAPEDRLFIASAFSGTGRIAYSLDGFTWTTVNGSIDSNRWFALKYAPQLRRYIALGDTTGVNQIATSTNGVDWVTIAAPTAVRWLGLAWSPRLGMFVATAVDAAMTMYSRDGVNWIANAIPSNNGWYRIEWVDEIGRFVCAGTANTKRLMTSTDGLFWEEIDIGSQAWVALGWSPKLRQLLVLPEDTSALARLCQL